MPIQSETLLFHWLLTEALDFHQEKSTATKQIHQEKTFHTQILDPVKRSSLSPAKLYSEISKANTQEIFLRQREQGYLKRNAQRSGREFCHSERLPFSSVLMCVPVSPAYLFFQEAEPSLQRSTGPA